MEINCVAGKLNFVASCIRLLPFFSLLASNVGDGHVVRDLRARSDADADVVIVAAAVENCPEPATVDATATGIANETRRIVQRSDVVTRDDAAAWKQRHSCCMAPVFQFADVTLEFKALKTPASG